jgi:endonuclease/exonuclease/phosphatase family metal-dependent hydrolase
MKLATPVMALLLAACATQPPPRFGDVIGSARPAVTSDKVTSSTTLDVLTFNIEGLGWPARRGRAASLHAISTTLVAVEKAGKAPDVVLIQEMFSPAAVKALRNTSYPNLVSGPARTDRKQLPKAPRMPGRYIWKKGELGFHLAGSGLAILSRYPIVAFRSEPFGRRCAGLDCLSNKGVLHARIAIPGVPESIDLFDTHMNSQGASRVPLQRHAAAHQRQVAELADFITSEALPDTPTILGGDFNMRRSELRYQRFAGTQRLTLVHRFCIENPADCDVRTSWDGDEPWLDTQDLQLFGSGKRVTVRPVRVEAMFDGSADSPKLSDHDGFRVVYRLSWATR